MSDIHITQDMLDAVVRGEMAPQVLSDAVLRHLLALCPYCRSEIQAWQRRRGEAGSHESTIRALPVLLEQQARDLGKREAEARRGFHALLKLAALLLFQQAAQQERLTATRVEGFVRYLKKARGNPSLRFKE